MQEHINRLCPETILWGGTGQARVVRSILEHFGSKVVAVFDDTPNLPSPFPDVNMLRGWEGFLRWISGRDRNRIGFCVAIGNPYGRVRVSLHDRLLAEGLQAATLAHPTAWIAENAVIESGCQMMAGAIVGVETHLGRQCIINTNASVDHECVLAEGVEVAPGATLCGLVKLGVNAWIGAGATVLPRTTIGADAIVAAGAVVTRSVGDGSVVVGVPARERPRA